MEAIAAILTANRVGHLPGGQAEEIQSTALASEMTCSLCGGTGWRRAGAEDFIGFRRCKCVLARIQAERLSAIPAVFRNASFASYVPRNSRQEWSLALMLENHNQSFYLTGAYGNGKTHLLYAQYRAVVLAGATRCHVRTMRELIEELRRAEFESDFISPVMAAASRSEPYHLFWDDIDKLKTTDFKTEVLFELVDSLYRHQHHLTVTGNCSMRDLIEHERMHPAIVRRLDDMCKVVEV